ncbi:Glutathione-independent glyoxalase HSP31 [Psilocybe cubensis]|uniref:Glutathione-independent glyoxalase HSP31 n=1 Tax=Psilocybe cubensis TaxID=181762 RepID=A0ACB8GR44_PSICU|nr:Glutathione-independent glyoxalase HSP31 [Psilocybe cubensis]KAH9477892.1 Glutathione-independent glyoxalase HSP31 [Psilocybe cubensis]
MPSELFVLTSADRTLTGAQTLRGWYLPEAAHPYYLLAPHATIDFAAPKGANPPLDESSVKKYGTHQRTQLYKDEESVRFLTDPVHKKLSEVQFRDYDAIFYVGGHGPVIDLPTDKDNIKLIGEVSPPNRGRAEEWVYNLLGNADGKLNFAGRTFTGFSNEEEVQVDKVADIPFLLEDRIQDLGGKYVKADKAWGVKIAVDGKLITGQNPASASAVGKALLQALGVH